MKLMVASYNNGALDWNAEAEETAFRSYTLDHEINRPARANILLADPTGAILRKYNVDANDVYIGVGKVTLEDPTATDAFFGRILRAVGDYSMRTVTLECEDTMGQLADQEITYDMREKLKGNLRQSTGHADNDLAKLYLIDAAVHTLFSAQAEDGGFTDETEEANELTDDDMTLMPALPVVNDAYYFGFESKVSGFFLYISQAGDWVGTNRWEYWDGGAWATLADFSPATQADQDFEVVGLNEFGWTVPGDWATVAVNGVTAYYVRARVNTFTGITTQPLGRLAYGEYYFYDDAMAWANDAYNDMNLVLTAGMAGTRTWVFHPYYGTDEASATVYNDNVKNLWLDDNTVDGGTHNANWYILYQFKAHLGNNTPSDLYIHDSITKAVVSIRYNITFTGAGNHGHIEIYDNNAAAYVELHHMEEEDIFHKDRIDVPVDIVPYIVDSDGFVNIRLKIDRLGGNATINVYYLDVEFETITSGISNAIAISDTITTNKLRIDTDLAIPATRVWERIPYCIAQPIHHHINTLVTAADTQFTMTTSVESTTGISTRQYKDTPTYSILRDLAIQDKAVMYVALGTAELIYKKTFGAHTAHLTDATVDNWRDVWDYNTMFNTAHVYGARLGDYEIFQSVEDTTSSTKYRMEKTKTIKSMGLVSDADAKETATTLSARDADPLQIVGCTLSGRDDTHRLGTIVEITSSYLWSTASRDYIVYRWGYDSNTDKTILTLHPKVSIGLQDINFLDSKEENITQSINKQNGERFVPDNISQEVS